MSNRLLTILMLLLISSQSLADMERANQALARADYETAVAEFKRLAETGDAAAQASLGYLYYAGEGLAKDDTQAVYWYRKAAVQGNRDAQYNLAASYAFGEGIDRDLAEAAIWYRRAAEQGHVTSQYSLGISYLYGEGVAQDQAKAAHWFHQAAKQDDVRAQVHLASLYHTGQGLLQDYAKAVKWYQLAANNGDSIAQYNLATMYRAGNGVQQDYKQAKYWFKQSAQQGYLAAKNELSSMERERIAAQAKTAQTELTITKDQATTEQDKAKQAFFNDETELESAQSKEKMLMIDEPEPLAKKVESLSQPISLSTGKQALANQDYAEAVKQFKPLAEAGNSEAQMMLGTLYYTGKGVTQDFNQAYDWYKKSANQNNQEAQYNIGNLYLLGEGVQQDNTEAAKWYALASEQGHPKAKTNLDNLKQLEASKQLPKVDQAVAEKTQSDTVKSYADQAPTAESLHLIDDVSDDLTVAMAEPTAKIISPEDKAALEAEAIAQIIKKEIDRLHSFAIQGDPDAQYQLGTLYYLGKQAKQDYEQAALWYRRAAQQGNIDAQYHLGNLYLSGEGLQQDDQQAAYWHGLAAEKGHPLAKKSFITLQKTVSLEPVAAPTKQAITFDDTAISGKVEYEQGLSYAYGKTVQKDFYIAFDFFYQSAQKGYAAGQYRLAVAYFFGEGVRQNYKKAIEWYHLAAMQDYTLAQRNLAKIYLDGVALEQNKVQALAWYQVLANKGNIMDVYQHDELQKKLSEQERGQSQALANQILVRLGHNPP